MTLISANTTRSDLVNFNQIQHYPQYQSNWNYAHDFTHAMRSAGLNFKGEIIADGQIHRFETNKRGRKDGWYVFYGMAGAFGDWSCDIHEKWCVKSENVFYQDIDCYQEQIEDAKKAAEEERRSKKEETACRALDKWNSCSEIGHSSYLEKKQVGAFGIRFCKDLVVIPLRDITGRLWSLQRIAPDGSKRFMIGGKKKGCFHCIGAIENSKPIIITEGYATGASVYMATNQVTVIAFDAGNLEPVIEGLKQAYPKSSLIIAGDDDCWKDHNIGREKAEKVAQKHNCRLVFPKFKDVSTKPTDFNDLLILESKEEINQQISAALKQTTIKVLNLRELLSMEIQPREMILEPIIPEQGLTMIHAPRGIGKTQVSLMIAYTVATGSPMFDGKWHSSKANKVCSSMGKCLLQHCKNDWLRLFTVSIVSSSTMINS